MVVVMLFLLENPKVLGLVADWRALELGDQRPQRVWVKHVGTQVGDLPGHWLSQAGGFRPRGGFSGRAWPLGAACPPEQVREEIPPGRTWWPQDVGSHERARLPPPQSGTGGGSGLSQVGVGVARETGCPVWLSFHASHQQRLSRTHAAASECDRGAGLRELACLKWGTCHHIYLGCN